MNKLPPVDKNKLNYRQFFMAGVIIFITLAEILIDYVQAGFNPAIFYDAAYWVRLAMTCISVILVTLTVRDYFRERELTTNPAVKSKQDELDTVHAELSKRDLMSKLEAHIATVNKARKAKAYKEHLQYKLFKAKQKHKDKWVQRISTADADAEYLPEVGKRIKMSWREWIRYSKVSMNVIFARSGKAENDDDDLDSNEGVAVGEMLYRKLLPLIAMSIALSTLFFDSGGFATAVLINTFMKLFRIAMSMYTGAVSGQDFVKVNLLSKMGRRLDFIQKFLEKERQGKRNEPATEGAVE